MRFNPFNPQLPARPQIFVGREPELDIFEKNLMQTVHGSPMNMAITGNRGMGKTSMLVKFEDIAKSNRCLVVRISNYEGQVRDVQDLADYLEESLKREIVFNKTFGLEMEGVKEFLASLKPVVSYKDLDFSIEKKKVRQEILRQSLLTIWKKIQTKYPACVIMIDEAESLEKVEGGLIFLREVFQRIGTDANYMIVLAGKLSFPDRMSESFSPLNRFFPTSQLIPLSFEDCSKFVTKQMTSVGVGVTDDALKELFTRSEGHPYVLVAMSYVVFDALPKDKNRVDGDLVIDCMDKILMRLGQDFFSPMFSPLSPKGKEIVKRLTVATTGTTFSFAEARKWTGLGPQQLSPYLVEIVKKGIINKKQRGEYEFFHPLFVEYVKRIEAV